MRIPAVLNVKDFSGENGIVDEKAYEKLNAYVDDVFRNIADNKRVIQTGICAIKGKINEKLQERQRGAYQIVLSVADSMEYRNLQTYDYELDCFQTAVRIYQAEKDVFETTIFDTIEYLDDFQYIYRQMLFFFRRMQMDFPEALQRETMQYIKSKGLSLYAVEEIFYSCKVGKQGKVALALAELYVADGQVKEAIFILSHMLERGQSQYTDRLIEKRNEYLGKL